MNKKLCRHEWVEVDDRAYTLRCKKCGLYVKQGVMSLGSMESVAPTVAPTMVNHQKKIVEDEIYKELRKGLLKPLFKSASH